MYRSVFVISVLVWLVAAGDYEIGTMSKFDVILHQEDLFIPSRNDTFQIGHILYTGVSMKVLLLVSTK